MTSADVRRLVKRSNRKGASTSGRRAVSMVSSGAAAEKAAADHVKTFEREIRRLI